MFSHPEDGCPAEKYEFNSLYKELLKKQQEQKEKEAKVKKRWP